MWLIIRWLITTWPYILVRFKLAANAIFHYACTDCRDSLCSLLVFVLITLITWSWFEDHPFLPNQRKELVPRLFHTLVCSCLWPTQTNLNGLRVLSARNTLRAPSTSGAEAVLYVMMTSIHEISTRLPSRTFHPSFK